MLFPLAIALLLFLQTMGSMNHLPMAIAWFPLAHGFDVVSCGLSLFTYVTFFSLRLCDMFYFSLWCT